MLVLKQVFSIALLAAAALLLSGCLDTSNFNFQANSSVSVDNGSVSVSVNATGVPQLEAFVPSIPSNISVCIYGEPDERFSYNAFGNLSIADRRVALYTRWFDANTTSRNASFDGCAAIILLDDGQGRFVERNVREKIVLQFKKGAGLIVSGEGGALSAQDASVYGWRVGGLDEFVPVVIEAPGKDAVPLGRTTFSGKFAPVVQDPALLGVSEFFFDSWSVVHSLPVENSQVVAFARQGGQSLPTQPVYPAIVRTRESPAHNTGYYFAYNAPEAPQIFVNTARFLSSEYFKYFFLRVA